MFRCLRDARSSLTGDRYAVFVRGQLPDFHLPVKVMAAEDYKADVSLTSACGQELAELQCAKEQKEEQEEEHAAVHLSTVLLCLEAGIREEKVKVTTNLHLGSNSQNHKDNICRLGADVSLRCRRSGVH